MDFLLPSLGLPSIPPNLVQAIKEGKFVDFRDLLTEALREQVLHLIPSRSVPSLLSLSLRGGTPQTGENFPACNVCLNHCGFVQGYP